MKYATRLTNRLISMGAISQQAVSFLNRDAQRCRKENIESRFTKPNEQERRTCHAAFTYTHTRRGIFPGIIYMEI